MREILEKIVLNKDLHKRWFHTLSFMENAGARKISSCEDSRRLEFMDIPSIIEYIKKILRFSLKDF